MKNERCPDGPKKICPEQTCPVAPACLTISRAVHNKDGDRIRIQVRVQGQILDFDMTPESFALAVTGLGEVPMSLERWRGRKEASPPSLTPPDRRGPRSRRSQDLRRNHQVAIQQQKRKK